MADDKRHLPSPMAIRKLRQEGDFPQSADLTAAVALFAGVVAIAFSMGPAATIVTRMTSVCITEAVSPPNPSIERAMTVAAAVLAHGMLLCMPVILAGAAAALFIWGVQVRHLPSLEAVSFRPQRLNPATGLKQLFLNRDGAVRLLLSLVKLVVVAWIFVAGLRSHWPDIIGCVASPPARAAEVIRDAGMWMAWRTCLVLLVFGGAHLLYVLWSWMKNHLLTDEEHRQQLVDEEGHPETRRAMAEIRREILQQTQDLERQLSRLDMADMGTRNPTHLVCFLRFDPTKEHAPRVVAKGTGLVAERLIEAAKRKGIPMSRRPQLARALHKVKLDEEIPRELYVAVRTLMEWLERSAEQGGRTTKWAARRAASLEAAATDSSSSAT